MSSRLWCRHANAIKRGAKRAGDVHAGSLGIGRRPPHPATQPAGSPQLRQQPCPLGFRPGGPLLITCGVRHIKFSAKFPQALLI